MKPSLNRRVFLQQLSAATLAGPALLAQSSTPSNLYDQKIKRIRLSTLQGRYHKFVSMNAYDVRPEGHTYEHTLFRIETDSGLEGLAPGAYTNLCTPAYARTLQPLIGARIGDLYTFAEGRITGRAPQYASLLASSRHLDAAFFDLYGKISNKPAWAFIGNEGKPQTSIYDGTVYFADVWFSDRGLTALKEECAEAVHSGFRGVKIKLGRGDKWMPREAGERRDIEAVFAAREGIGPDALLFADPNYAYRNRYPQAVELHRQVKPARLTFMEEIFPENPALYTQLRSDLAAQNNPCKIAFGEHLRAVEAVNPYLHPTLLVDYLQYDIRTNGFVDIAQVARNAASTSTLISTHNWASQMGYIMSLHMARAIGNYGIAECDRSTCDVLHVEPLPIHNGVVVAPSLPGLGITINEDVYRLKHTASEIVVS